MYWPEGFVDGIKLDCRNWIDCDGDENGDCFFIFEGAPLEKRYEEAVNCDSGMDPMKEYGDKLVIEMDGMTIMILSAFKMAASVATLGGLTMSLF